MKLLGEIRNVYLYIEKENVYPKPNRNSNIGFGFIETELPFVFFCFLMVFGQWVQLLVLEFVVHNSKIKA